MILFVNYDFGELDANSYIIECVSRLQSIAPDNYKQVTFTEMALSSRSMDNKYIIGMVSDLKTGDNCFKEHFILGEVATLTREQTITLDFIEDYKNLSQIIHAGDLIMLYNFRLENIKNATGRGRRQANMLPYKITSAFEGFKLFFMNGNSHNLNNICDRLEIQKFNLELSDYGNCKHIKQIIRNSSNTFQESILFTEDNDVVTTPVQNDKKKRSKTPVLNGLKTKEQDKEAKSRRIGKLKKRALQRTPTKKSNKDDENSSPIKDLTSDFPNELTELKTEIQRVVYIRDHLLLSAKRTRQKLKSQNTCTDSLPKSTIELTSIKNIRPKFYFNLECQVLGVLTNDNSDVHCILLCWDGTKPRMQFQSPSMGQWSAKFKDNECDLLTEYTLFINVFGEHVLRLHDLKLHQLIRVTSVHAKFVQRKLMCDLNVGGVELQRGLQKMNVNSEGSKALEDRLWKSRSAIQIQRHIETFDSVLSDQGKEAVEANNKKIEECWDIGAIIDNCDQLLTIFSTKLSDERKKSSDENFIESADKIISSIEKIKASNHNITSNEEDELIIMDDHETNEQSDCLKIENIYSLSNPTALEMWNPTSGNLSDATANSEELEIEFEAHQVKTGIKLKSELPDPIDAPCDGLEWLPPNFPENVVDENLESNESIVAPGTLSVDLELRSMRLETFSNEDQPLLVINQMNKRQSEICDEENKRSKPADPNNDRNNNPFELNRISRITTFLGKFSTIPELNSAADQQLCSFRGVIVDIYPRSDHVIDAFKLLCRGCKNTFSINNQRQRECKVSGNVCDVAPSLHFKLRLCDPNKDLVDVIIRDENAEQLFWGTRVESLRSPENLKLLSEIVRNLCRSPAHLSSNSYVLHCNVKVSVERRNKRTFYLQDTVLECGCESHNHRIP